MAFKFPMPLLLLLFTNLANATDQIKLFINQLPEYSSLADCAEYQVSTVVRNMANGCGDGSKTTSYNCFCHASSSYFSSYIGSKVEKACETDNPDLQSTSAVKLFNSYCHLGDSLTTDSTISSTSSSSSSSSTSSVPSSTSTSASSSIATSQSTSASPASTPQIASASATISETAAPEPPKKTNTAAIAAGVTVPVVLIAAAIAGFFIFRRRNQQPTNELAATGSDPAEEGHNMEAYAQDTRSVHTGYSGQSEIYELKQDTAPLRPVEIGGSVAIHEMDQPVNELPARYSRS